MWPGCMSAPVCAPRRIIIQKPKTVDSPPVERKPMCRTLPNGRGCMIPPNLLRGTPMVFNRKIDPVRRLYESIFPIESPYTFEGDPGYDWSIYATDFDTEYYPRRFTYQQKDATAVGQLKLLKHPYTIPQEEIISPAGICCSSAPRAAQICHPESFSQVCPKIFMQDQIFRGDCPKIPRRRNLLLEGCTAQFDRPGRTNPYTGHFTPVMRFPPEYFQMRQYLALKSLEAVEDEKYSNTSSQDVLTPRSPSAALEPCPRGRPITKGKSSPNFLSKSMKPCKKQAAFLSTGRPGATYYEPRDKEQLEKLVPKSKWDIVREKLGEISKLGIKNEGLSERERKMSLSTPASRKITEKNKLFHEHEEEETFSEDEYTDNTLTRSKSAYYQPRKESSQPNKSYGDSLPIHLAHQDAIDNKFTPSRYRKKDKNTDPSRSCCLQYPPSIDNTKPECPTRDLSRSFSSTPLKVRSDFFENCEETCTLLDRYKRAHILSLDRWAMDPKREFHLNSFDAVSTSPRYFSAPTGRKTPSSLVPCSIGAPTDCNNECLHPDYDCYLKPPVKKVQNKLSLFAERQASTVGQQKAICKIKDRNSPIDCLKCMRSGCLKLTSEAEHDDTPCILKDLMEQDAERRKLRPYCRFLGPEIQKKHKIPMIAPRNPSAIGKVPYESMYKVTKKVETTDERLMRDLAWLRSKVSSLLKPCCSLESIYGKRAESRVGKVPLDKTKLLDKDVCQTCFIEGDCNVPRLNIFRRKIAKKAFEYSKNACQSTNTSEIYNTNSKKRSKGH